MDLFKMDVQLGAGRAERCHRRLIGELLFQCRFTVREEHILAVGIKGFGEATSLNPHPRRPHDRFGRLLLSQERKRSAPGIIDQINEQQAGLSVPNHR